MPPPIEALKVSRKAPGGKQEERDGKQTHQSRSEEAPAEGIGDLGLQPIAQSPSYEGSRGHTKQVDAKDQHNNYCGAHRYGDKVLHGREQGTVEESHNNRTSKTGH